MQDKKQNNSPIKQRILYFVDYLKISKREFYNNTGISRGTLDNTTGITEETIAKLFARYGDINSHWLLTGEGEMVKGDTLPIAAEPAPVYQTRPACPLCQEKEKVIQAQQRTIDILDRELHHCKVLYDEEREKGHHDGQKRKVG